MTVAGLVDKLGYEFELFPIADVKVLKQGFPNLRVGDTTGFDRADFCYGHKQNHQRLCFGFERALRCLPLLHMLGGSG